MNEEHWNRLPATEKEQYLTFHRTAFEEDMRHAEKNALDFPRWSVISGYYCMHDITKLFLAKNYDIKIGSLDAHAKTIEALEHFIKDGALKQKLLSLLAEASDIYYDAERLKERTLPTLLRKGREERRKARYYADAANEVNAQKTLYFLDTIVKPYVKIIRGLMD